MENDAEQLIDEEIRAHHEEIEQLKVLKKMSKNPKLAALMRKIGDAATANGNGVHKPSTDSAPRNPPPADKRSRNGLTDAVTKAVGQFGNQRFVIHDVVKKVEASGFKFVAKDHRIAVSAVLDKLLKRGVIYIAEKRVGNAPHLYEYLGERKA
ncbi:MAG: hypothetical protein ABSE86_29435 [Bryobacteraceae bacterium]|jgi:hypothetical protein